MGLIDHTHSGKLILTVRLVKIEPAVLAIYAMPVGTDMEFDSQRKVFIDSNTGKEYR